MAAAVLTIDFNARLAKLEEGLTQANRRLGIFQGTVVSAGNSLKNIFGGIAIGATVGKFIQLTKAAIDGADKLKDLSSETGIAATRLGGIGFAAEQAGSSLDAAIPGIGRLNQELAKAAAGNETASATFAALGLSVRDIDTGKAKDAGQVLIELAARFEQYEDGPNKAALANALFKRGYGELLPLLNEGSESLRKNIEYFQKYSGLTDDLVNRSDAFNDELAKVNLLTASFFRHLASELLPALQALTGELVNVEEEARGFKETASDVATVIKGIAVAAIYGSNAIVGLGRSLGVTAAQATLLAKLDFKGIRNLGEEFEKELEGSRARRDALINAIQNPAAAVVTPKGPRIQAPGLPDKDASKAAKALLDTRLSGLADFIRDEQSLLADREHFLAQYYQDDEISIRDFFNARASIQAEALQKQLAAYDDEIAALRKFAATRTGDERIKAEGDIAEAIRKRANLEEQAAKRANDLFFDQRRALKGFRDDIEQTSIRLLELSGDRVGAVLAAFDFGNRERTVRIGLELESPDAEVRRLAEIAQRQLEREREQVKVQAQLNESTQRFGDLLELVGNAQTRINIARQAGSLTELEALRASGDANRALIPVLQEQLRIFEEIAVTASDPRALLAAEQLRLKIEELAASGDLVAEKFNNIFIDSFSDALTKITQKGAKFKDIIKELEQSLVQSITRVASQNISETLFKPENFGGIGKFFGDMFGGKSGAGGATGAAALTGAGTTLTGAGTLLTTAGTLLNTSAAALTAAAASMTAASAASAFGGFGSPGIASDVFSFFGFAGGTNFAPGGPALVGERGREIVVLPRGAQVIPNTHTERILSSVRSITREIPGFANGTQSAPGGMAMVGERGRELVVLPGGMRSERILRSVSSTTREVPHFADGTPLAPGGLAMVGERGREIVVLPKGAKVIPNERTERIIKSISSSVTREYMPRAFADGTHSAPGGLAMVGERGREIVVLPAVQNERPQRFMQSITSITNNAPRLASGSPFTSGGFAVVGEQGRELVRLPRGSQVIPNERTEQIMSGKSVTINAPINITVQGNPSTRTMNQIGVEAYRGITRAQRRDG